MSLIWSVDLHQRFHAMNSICTRQGLWSTTHDTNTSFPSELVLNPNSQALLQWSWFAPFPYSSPQSQSQRNKQQMVSKERVSVQGLVLDAQNYFNEAGMQWAIYFTLSQSQRSSQYKYSSKTTSPRLLYSKGHEIL